MLISRTGELLSSRPARLLSACLLCTASLATAQVMQTPGTLPNGSHIAVPSNPAPPPGTPGPAFMPKRSDPRFPLNAARGIPQSSPAQPPAAPRATQPTPAPAAAPVSTAPSLSDQPAKPAQVSLQGGQLTVTANNSDLTQILHDLASTSGMSIDGLSRNARVFGVYGPGSPRDVISDLLADSGYNFMMVGDTPDGAPRQLLLTSKNDSAPSPATSNARGSSDQDDDSQPTFVMNQPDPNAPAPGAANNPPPEQVQPQNSQGGIKSPQQILQELQQMHQQQLQQQQQSAPQ